MIITKPMLAATLKDPSKLTDAFLCSPKLDGIRCIVHNGQVLSRSLKRIPNLHISTILSLASQYYPDLVFDGELMIKGKPFNETSSAVMSRDGIPDFEYHVFDVLNLHKPEPLHTPFYLRARWLNWGNMTSSIPSMRFVPQTQINNLEELNAFEEKCLAEGYEGVMLRSMNGPYKLGRSTLNEGYLLKMKRFETSEAIVTGFRELMHNDNPKLMNELGYSDRSTHKENMVPMSTLGALVCTTEEGVEFEIGTGFTQPMRQEIWNNKALWLGAKVTYKHQAYGAKDKPRCPVFVGRRHEDDL